MCVMPGSTALSVRHGFPSLFLAARDDLHAEEAELLAPFEFESVERIGVGRDDDLLDVAAVGEELDGPLQHGQAGDLVFEF